MGLMMLRTLFAGTAMKMAAGFMALLLIIIGVLIWRLHAAGGCCQS
jgi:hypothetical protein